jgi:GTP-binding protein YchF
MRLGIIGLPYVGKSTIFSCLTRAKGTATHPGEAGVAVIKVPDLRLDRLEELFKPPKKTLATIECVDCPALGAEGDAEIKSTQLLAQLRLLDAFVEVVRFFESASVAHVDGSLDPARDLARLESEFILTDLIVVENRIERIAQPGRGAKVESSPIEKALLARLKETLEKGAPLRNLDFSPDEEKLLTTFGFLSKKPLLVVPNVDEAQLTSQAGKDKIADFIGRIEGRRLGFVEICGQVEKEISELSPAEEKAFLKEYGLAETGSSRIIREAYRLLDQISFLTAGEKEVRAWPVPRGSTALKAAGTIHTDFERGFIKAEVTAFEKLSEAGSFAHAREKGWLRLEGKEYVVQDGDVITFRFNV